MLKVYNTLTNKKEIFKPQAAKKVNLFVCGPTVYDFSHLGHARTYVAFDVITKYLKFQEFDVFYLQNITDIDDKIIQRAKETNVSWKALSKKFEKEYFKDIGALKIDSITKYARATDHIKEIISQVNRLLQKGYAYKIDDGIYYDISKFKNYGKLSRRTIEQAEDAISRIDESKQKRNKGDFCLWKFSKTGEPMWDFKTGKFLGVAGPNFAKASTGKPGWHIEDTAIAEKFLGTQYDVHGGARDLIFPHHEAEIAQMEAISNKSPFVKYWLHTGFLTVNGQKMSKSLGNSITINNFLKQNSCQELRLLIAKNHYRSPFDFNERLLQETKNQIQKFDEFFLRIKDLKNNKKQKFQTQNINALVKKAQKSFKKAMDDDFNTPKALAVILGLIKEVNREIDKNNISKEQSIEIIKFLKQIDKIFGFIFSEKIIKIPENIKKLAEKREFFRQQKDWQASDKIRNKLMKMGYEIKDTDKGPVLRKRQ